MRATNTPKDDKKDQPEVKKEETSIEKDKTDVAICSDPVVNSSTLPDNVITLNDESPCIDDGPGTNKDTRLS